MYCVRQQRRIRGEIAVKTDSNNVRWKKLAAASLAHVTHDGFSDMLYVFLPVWQVQLALNYSQVGILRTLYSGTMALFQIPSGILAERFSDRTILLIGTIATSLVVYYYGFTSSPVVLGLLLLIGGTGASVQHPLSSSVVLSAYKGGALRTALSTYNFSGDIGKLIVPAVAAILISQYSLSVASNLLSIIGFSSSLMLFYALKPTPINTLAHTNQDTSKTEESEYDPKSFLNPGFISLAAISIIDSATRTGFLIFFPFLLRGKGAGLATIGFALSLISVGGAIGKFVCGVLATRVGILRSVCLTETVTAICIASMLLLPLKGALLLAPFLGIALNGTSSVLYGSVPELVPELYAKRAFSFFYTIAIGSGAIAPTLYGFLGDLIGINNTLVFVALFVLLAIPLTLPLRGKLNNQSAEC